MTRNLMVIRRFATMTDPQCLAPQFMLAEFGTVRHAVYLQEQRQKRFPLEFISSGTTGMEAQMSESHRSAPQRAMEKVQLGRPAGGPQCRALDRPISLL